MVVTTSVELMRRYSNHKLPGQADRILGADPAPTRTAGHTTQVRRPPRRISSDDVNDMVKRFRAGQTVKDISAALGVHRATVAKHLEKRGITERRQARRLSVEEVDQMVELYQAGQSLATIGKQFGVHHDAVRYRLRQKSVAMRKSAQSAI